MVIYVYRYFKGAFNLRIYFKNLSCLLLLFLLILSFVSCKEDNFNERLEKSKTLDLYSYNFVFEDNIINDIDLVSTYEEMGCTFTTSVTSTEAIDLNTILAPGKSAKITALLSKDEKIIFNLTIVNNTNNSKAYKDCSIISSGISENSSIILPQGLYCNMSEKELIEKLGEPIAINENELFYFYTYFQFPYKVDGEQRNNITGNGYYFNISKETKTIHSFIINRGIKPIENLTEYSALVTPTNPKVTFTTKAKISNSYDWYGYTNINRLQTIVNINNIPYIISLNSDFNILPSNTISKPLDYAFLFEKACDPVNPIEFTPDYLYYSGNSGYSYGFRDNGDKYTCKLNFVNSQGYINSEDSYIKPLNQEDKITDAAKEEFKNIIKTFSTNLQFEM